MFDKDFYPTPEPVIKKMLEDYYSKSKRTNETFLNLSRYRILEPSAGKGDILDFISENSLYKEIKKDLFAIERNSELQNIILNKGYNLIDTDFLKYSDSDVFDLIIMNPPFSDGASHLLKAWEESKGADIRCLLNWETINNPYTKERQLLFNLIEKYGSYEYLGNCFKDSERTTNVEVVLVKLKNTDYKNSFSFEESNFDTEDMYLHGSDFSNNTLEVKDDLKNMEIRYNKVKELMSKMIKLQGEIDFYSKGLIDDKLKMLNTNVCDNPRDYFNRKLVEFKTMAWNKLITSTNIRNMLTSKTRDSFNELINKKSNMSFTKSNIIKLRDELFLNSENIMQKCIEESFDYMTEYYDENRSYVEGWKTNDQWKVNKKVILPRMKDDDDNYLTMNFTARDKMSDIEKALCFIVKKSYETIDSIPEMIYKNNQMARKGECDTLDFGKWYDSEFFEWKMFKKSTIHLKFKDDWQYEQFNLIATKSRGWLGN